LKRLGTDYIDLYQIHWPDPLTPVEETLDSLNDLVRAGKVRYLGCSNYAGWQVADASWVAKTRNLTPFVSAQNQYSLLNRDLERDLVPACERFGLGVLPYFPLASGLLSGKYRRGEAPPVGTRLHGERHSQLLQEAVTSVIAGATSGEQVHANVAASGWQPSHADLAELDEITKAP
jgi:aryl-alcohol dehydrogenase-like predicted oxidoreductase